MSRGFAKKVVEVPATTITESFTVYKCDSCGRDITPEWPESEENHNFAHELCITLDHEECVNFFRRRDYCPSCMDPIWEAINRLIAADPEAERDRDYD